MNKQMAKLATMFIRDRDERKKRQKALIEQSINKTKLIMVLLCKDEADILDDWFLFHKAMGVDAFIVTDTAPPTALAKFYKSTKIKVGFSN